MSVLDGSELAGLEYLEFEEGIEKSSQVDNEISKVVGLMESILNSSGGLTWDDLYKLYTQWYELHCLVVEGVDVGELKNFDAFCVATQKIMARPINCNDDTGHIISLILFIEDFRKVSSNSSLMNKFRWYLPDFIPQDMIDSAQTVWKNKMLSGESSYSDDPRLFFPELDRDSGYYPDLDYLRFFHERATDDTTVSGWYEKFKPYMRPTE